MERIKAILVLTAAVAFAVSPLISTGFNGFSPDQFPVPQTDPPIQPAGWAFSIWLPIYAWLVASGGYGLLRRDNDPDWGRTRWPLIVSLAVGAAWIPVANISPEWATALIWIMWATAVLTLLRSPGRDRWWLRAPVALYAGWLTAAASVASGLLATGYGIEPVVTTHAGFLLLALALASMVLRLTGEPVYVLAILWALAGIAVANLEPLVTIMVLLPVVGAILLAIPVLARMRRSSVAS
ncbi:hypothetical protein OB2597_03734 [Pseudooceanicola batsensis HTCC2597]|uniref:Uncharacterized protein n=1 Tax=Pseudooceanicola batsensis (strain ATCC BAA-863 / DSM 15984 / KCTC 12145 / HTCC2597) TaxID=252305 RepID=A3U3T0_PSEBH|nr:tryptophan-rich sensory protein [Pseudooceanicola batsensis]EAQ01169.1 hypothetical protein OB2597_03734 [Pseudooceanicola batsensis HTCC2597]